MDVIAEGFEIGSQKFPDDELLRQALQWMPGQARHDVSPSSLRP